MGRIAFRSGGYAAEKGDSRAYGVGGERCLNVHVRRASQTSRASSSLTGRLTSTSSRAGMICSSVNCVDLENDSKRFFLANS